MSAVERIGEGRVSVALRYEAPDAGRVVVAGGLAMVDPHDMEMRRDGDAWVREYECASNLRTVYGFHPGRRLDALGPAGPGSGEPADVRLPGGRRGRGEQGARPLARGATRCAGVRMEHASRRPARARGAAPPRQRAAGQRAARLPLRPARRPFTQICAVPTTLDNLIAAGEIPPVLAILPDSLDQETRTQELTFGDDFLAFVVDELLPWAGAEAGPEKTVVAGSSLGGLMACYAGIRRPDVFGNVLSMSGSLQREPAGESPGWVQRHLAETERLPVRWHLNAGELELWMIEGRAGIRHANRHLADVLRAKGYEVTHREFPGGHDYLWWGETIAWGLRDLLAID